MTQQDDPLAQLEHAEGHLLADPGNPHLLARCIDLALACGQAERAGRHARAAMQRFPEDEFFVARAANVLLAERRWADAAALLEPIFARRPELPLAFNLASAYSWLGRYDEAWQALERFAGPALADGEAGALLVRVQHHRGEVDAAMALADAALEQCPTHPSLLGAASAAYFDGGRLEDALRCSERALEGQRRPLEALVISGSLMLGAGDAAGARQRFGDALAANADEARAWNGMGIACLLDGDFKGAAENLERALRHMPGHIGSWHALAWSKLFGNDLEGAAAAFGKALELDRNVADSHGGLAAVDALRGRRAEAEAGVARALRLDPASLAAAYARLLLDGAAADSARFRQIALRLLSSRPALPGSSVADLVRRVRPG